MNDREMVDKLSRNGLKVNGREINGQKMVEKCSKSSKNGREMFEIRLIEK